MWNMQEIWCCSEQEKAFELIRWLSFDQVNFLLKYLFLVPYSELKYGSINNSEQQKSVFIRIQKVQYILTLLHRIRALIGLQSF